MNNDKIIEKARKFLNMANNSAASKSESIQAAAHLKKLLDKHNLSMGEITKEQVAADISRENYDTKYKAVPYEQLSLASSIARGYGCDMVATGAKFTFIGPEVAAIVAKEMYAYISHRLWCLAGVNCIASGTKGAAKRAYTRSFIIAAGFEIEERLKEASEPEQTESYELVRQPAVEEAVAHWYPSLRSRKMKGHRCDEGMFDGSEAGKTISLNKQVTA